MRSAESTRAATLAPSGVPDAAIQALILRHVHDAVFATDLDNRVTFWGHSAERLFGYSQEQAIGRAFGELLPFRIAGSAGQADLLETIRSERTWRGEGAVLLPTGAELWIESTVNPIVIDGQVVGSVSVSRDMTLQRREAEGLAAAERARRESEEQFREAFEFASIGMALVGLDGRWLKVNPALIAMLGYSEDELLARSFQDITHPDDLADDLALVEAVLAGTIPGYRMDKRYIHRDGHAVHATLSVSQARDADGRACHFVSQISDRSAEADLALEAQVRIVLAEGLHNVPAEASLEQAAQSICHDLAALPWVDFAAVEAFLADDDVEVVANWARDGFPTQIGAHLSPRRAHYLAERAARGPWADLVSGHDGPDDFALAAEAGLAALAYSPIANGHGPLGVLIVGTGQAGFAQTLVEKMPGMVAFGTASSALLGERLLDHRRRHADRADLERELATGAFHAVFQPIVDLETRTVVGHEALTRFDSGVRPDLRFAAAWEAGLGPDLEFATLGAAIAAGARLPAGGWLDLNVSPRLLADADELRRICGRPTGRSCSRSPSTRSSPTIRPCARRSAGSGATSASPSMTQAQAWPTSATSSSCAPTS